MQKNIAAFTIQNNHADNMVVSHLVIGYSRVDAFYKEYSSLPESERAFLVNDIFMYDDLEKAIEDHIDAIIRCKDDLPLNSVEDVSPKVICKIVIPEDYNSSVDEHVCEMCGWDTDDSYGDSRHTIRVRDEVYGTWSDQRVCVSCYHADIEKSFNIK